MMKTRNKKKDRCGRVSLAVMNLSIFVNNSEGGTVGSYPDSIGLQRNFNIRFPESDMTNNVFSCRFTSLH